MLGRDSKSPVTLFVVVDVEADEPVVDRAPDLDLDAADVTEAPEVRDRHRLSRIPHPTAGTVPNIETPLQMSLTPTVDPVAAPLLGEHTRDVLRKTLGYDERRIVDLAEAGAFGKPGNTA